MKLNLFTLPIDLNFKKSENKECKDLISKNTNNNYDFNINYNDPCSPEFCTPCPPADKGCWPQQ